MGSSSITTRNSSLIPYDAHQTTKQEGSHDEAQRELRPPSRSGVGGGDSVTQRRRRGSFGAADAVVVPRYREVMRGRGGGWKELLHSITVNESWTECE